MTKKHRIREISEITFGVILIASAFYFLFLPSELVTGGVTGLSIVFKEMFKANEIAVSIFILIANLILLIIGGVILGKNFFLRTIYGTLLLPFITLLLSLLPIDSHIILNNISQDSNKIIIISTVGGLITGAGLGLVFKNNATTGGTDVLQRILYEKLKVPFSFAIYLTDGLIIAIGFFIFGIDNTYFAIIALIISGTLVDKVLLSGRSGYTVFIVTSDYQKLKDEIYLKVNRGITKVSAVGGYSDKDRDMIICTISKNQLYHLKSVIQENDPTAFTFITKTVESVGQGFH